MRNAIARPQLTEMGLVLQRVFLGIRGLSKNNCVEFGSGPGQMVQPLLFKVHKVLVQTHPAQDFDEAGILSETFKIRPVLSHNEKRISNRESFLGVGNRPFSFTDGRSGDREMARLYVPFRSTISVPFPLARITAGCRLSAGCFARSHSSCSGTTWHPYWSR